MEDTTKDAYQPVSILGASIRFKGELRADEDILIKGVIEGNVTHTRRMTVCRGGTVDGVIRGHVVAVEGTVNGDVMADVSVAMLTGSVVTGDVHSPSVSVVKGATLNGKVQMKEVASTPKRVERPVAAVAFPQGPNRIER